MWKNVDRFCKWEVKKRVKTVKNKVLLLSVYFCRKLLRKKRNPQPNRTKNVDKVVGNVDN